jgi:flagellar basal-body rod protein FlgF
MSFTLYDAAQGARLQEMRLTVLSNNLANLNTVGFKEDRPAFQISTPDGSRLETAQAGGQSPTEAPPLDKWTNFSAGLLQKTGNRLDIALEGKGFFCVKTPDGTFYTRKGNFSLSPGGTLVTQEGFPVLGKGDEIRISPDGEVAVDATGGVHVGGVLVETLRIVEFQNPNALMKIGNSFFTPAEGAGEPVPAAEKNQLHQGFVELANVEAVKTMVELIELTRGYETYQKIIQSYNEVTGKAVNEVGGLN